MKITSEDQLQAACVMWFYQTFPEKQGQLWATNNNTYSMRHGMAMKARGLIDGVSDLILFDYSVGGFFGVELKLPGKVHNKDHIRQQIKWGRTIQENGGQYRIVRSLEGFQSIVLLHGEHEDVLTISEVELIINQSKTKTVKF